MAETQLVNTVTGERLDLSKMNESQISNVLLEIDEAEKAFKKLKDEVKKYVEANREFDDKFGDWSVRIQNRTVVKEPEIEVLPPIIQSSYLQAKKIIEDVKAKYGKTVITQFKVWNRPKF